MDITIVTITKNNKLISNKVFQDIKEAEAFFSKSCLNLDNNLDTEQMEDFLDDGYFESNDSAVCINSWSNEPQAFSHVAILIEDNIVSAISPASSELDAQHEFKLLLDIHSSNGSEYTDEDFAYLFKQGYESINTKKLYFVAL